MSEQLPPPDADGDAAAEKERAARQERVADADAWATAAAEDLAAEKARRRAAHGPPPGSAAEELRRLVDTVADKLSGLPAPLFGPVAGTAAQQVVKQVVQQAKAAVEPVIERNPDVFDHLAAAGGELLAAYRSAVQNQERRWTTGATAPRDAADAAGDTDPPGDDGGEGTGPGQRIDLD
ncbi:DUF5304 family protein [Streptomyces griseoviridis]|jgi:hypothetical protein|uniref:DUF5304 domain-containing protein n=3 Tax=Streptomyces TaxID=1883 RepID=A0ABT9LC63_STRGD|nr:MULTISPECIES: DUF5304 family protein [Streptomyces]MDP9681312.1 hypothetical protein [Streptomyces griseoviridis]GGS21822.1 hypothetical protein GCM10010238_07780 [Streptomyces niveoruber]GGS75563.1 hypothetical protein GCM10010240_05830 [Streptomyces griseoviridis]GGU37169.1 hypothetical protein GCM10010259_29590 [Streptomyces daghestanicus]GHI34687.1 hypothetical protein Sdagh_64170 [Streptomyces daghestanicus]